MTQNNITLYKINFYKAGLFYRYNRHGALGNGGSYFFISKFFGGSYFG